MLLCSGERWLVLEVAFKMEKKRRGDRDHRTGGALTAGVTGIFCVTRQRNLGSDWLSNLAKRAYKHEIDLRQT